MWYVLKLDYTAPDGAQTRTKMTGYNSLATAERVFERLEQAYLLDSPLRIRNGQKMRVVSASLLESFRDHYADAVAAATAGEATVMMHTQELDLEL